MVNVIKAHAEEISVCSSQKDVSTKSLDFSEFDKESCVAQKIAESIKHWIKMERVFDEFENHKDRRKHRTALEEKYGIDSKEVQAVKENKLRNNKLQCLRWNMERLLELSESYEIINKNHAIRIKSKINEIYEEKNALDLQKLTAQTQNHIKETLMSEDAICMKKSAIQMHNLQITKIIQKLENIAAEILNIFSKTESSPSECSLENSQIVA
jgi:hypothetical protein